MSVVKRILNEDYIHVIDDFYDSYDWLNKHLALAEFKRVEHVNYPGLTSMPPENYKEIWERVLQIFEHEIVMDAFAGQVRLTRAIDKDTEKSKIHIDKNQIIGLVFLSDLPPEAKDPKDYGTRFFKHKTLNKNKFLDLGKSRNAIQEFTAGRDTNNFEAWECWKVIPYKKNRAMFFNGNLYHAPTNVFWGKDAKDCRITQHFFTSLKK